MKRTPVISLIGRPNVGKSSIFNRLMRKGQRAMTHDRPGVTRDRHYGIATFENPTGELKEDCILVDTGGFYPEKIEEKETLGKKYNPDPFFNIMQDHARLAIDESDLVLFVVDVREGLLPFDKTIADFIRATKKPMWLLVNKFDSDGQWGEEGDFYRLGVSEDDFIVVSAEHGRGLGTIRDKVYSFCKDLNQEGEEFENIQRGVTPNNDVVGNVAIIGAPNAGKSTLLNKLIGSQRALVSNIAGTTVDPIEGYIDLYFGDEAEELNAVENQFRISNKVLLEEYIEFTDDEDGELLNYEVVEDDLNHQEEQYADFDLAEDVPELDYFSKEEIAAKFTDSDEEVETVEEETEVEGGYVKGENYSPYRSIKIVDTAGIRKSKLVRGYIESQSVYRSLRSIAEADVIIYMVDVTKGITHQDRRLCDIALEKGKSIIICLNKVDLIPEVMGDHKLKREWLLDLQDTIPWLSFCELITLSAMKGSFLNSLKKALVKTIIIRTKKIPTGKLNKIVSSLVDRHPVMIEKGKGVGFKVKYASMLKAAPPTFLLFTNKSRGIPANYRRYLSNGIRNEFKLANTPVHLIFRTTADIERRLKNSKDF